MEPGELGGDGPAVPARPTPVSVSWLRSTWTRATGDDPGPLEPSDELAALGLWGLDRMVVLGAVEAALDIELPADLVAELRTVGDLLHYGETLCAHRAQDGGDLAP